MWPQYGPPHKCVPTLHVTVRFLLVLVCRYGLSDEALRAVRALCLTKSMLRRLHNRFNDMDDKGLGQIRKVSDFWKRAFRQVQRVSGYAFTSYVIISTSM